MSDLLMRCKGDVDWNIVLSYKLGSYDHILINTNVESDDPQEYSLDELEFKIAPYDATIAEQPVNEICEWKKATDRFGYIDYNTSCGYTISCDDFNRHELHDPKYCLLCGRKLSFTG